MEQHNKVLTFSVLRLLGEGKLAPGRGHLYRGNCYVITDTCSAEVKEGKLLFTSPTRIDGFILLLCAQGEITLICNMRQVHIGSNMMFFARPGTIIQVTEVKDTHASVIMGNEKFLEEINISLQSLLPHFAALNEHYCFELSAEQFKQIHQQISILDGFISQPSTLSHYHELVQSTSRAIFYHFASLLVSYFKAVEQSGNSVVPSHEEIVFRRFVQLVGQYFRTERRITFYADQMHLTPKYMSSIIRRVSGHGPTEWISQNVLIEAKNLLRYTNMSIQEVSNTLNFPNQSFFGRWFKFQTGLPPKKYRSGKNPPTT